MNSHRSYLDLSRFVSYALAAPLTLFACSSDRPIERADASATVDSNGGLQWYDSGAFPDAAAYWDAKLAPADMAVADAASDTQRDGASSAADSALADTGSDTGIDATADAAKSIGEPPYESISGYGSYWNFEIENAYSPWPSNGSDLTSVPRYADGPCQGRAAGQCAFDTRAFLTVQGHLIESISAYGKYWNFDADDAYKPWDGNGSDLTSVPRYANGPCQGRAAGTCVFDTRTFLTVQGRQIESISAYGKYWNFDSDDAYKPWDGNGSDLTSVPRYANGPCKGRTAGRCVFGTRAILP
jgi:hypothetical protein